ncbi:MAG: Spy/CpxP family protein refolding chaperone [bacterium]
MRKSIIFVLALIFTAIPFIFAAEGPGPDGDDGIGPGMIIGGVLKIVDELKLSPAQEEQLQSLKDSSKREIFSMRNELKTTVWDIQDEFKNNPTNRDKINALTDKMANIERKLIKTRTEHMFKVKEILTDEQFNKMVSLLEKHKDKIQRKILDKNKK